jgi:hypothetical protein
MTIIEIYDFRRIGGAYESDEVSNGNGLLLKSNVIWDENPVFQFVIRGISDSDFSKDQETRKSVSGNSMFLCGATVIQRSSMQRIVALSVTEAELCADKKRARHVVHKDKCGVIGIECVVSHDSIS